MDRCGTYALVTGAGSGIGEATARKLAAEGAKVAVVGHSRDSAERTAASITDAGGSAFPLAAELADPTDRIRIRVDHPEGQIPLTGDTPGTSAQVTDLIGFLTSDAAAHITGTEVWIDGAQSLLIG